VGYVEQALLEEEKVKYRAKLHWVIYLTALAALILSIVFFGLAGALEMTSKKPDVNPTGFIIVGCFFLVISMVYGIPAFIKVKTSEFAVTDRRVIIKIGLISRRTLEMNVSKIENISIDQNIMGRILNYGSIVISGSGGTKETFKNIASPMDFKKAALTEAK